MPETKRLPTEPERSSRAFRLAIAAGLSALVAVALFATSYAVEAPKQPAVAAAARDEASAESTPEREPKRVATPSTGSVTTQVTTDEPGLFEEDDEDADEQTDPRDDRLSAELRLLENRRRAHDRLEASASSDRLSVADRAALDARRARLSEKLARHEQRVERLKQELGSESGHEAQNGMQ